MAFASQEKQWAVISRRCVEKLFKTRSADKTPVLYEQKLLYCCKLRDAIDANREVVKRDPELQFWYFNTPYTNLYFMRCSTHRRRVLEFEVRQRTAAGSPIFA